MGKLVTSHPRLANKEQRMFTFFLFSRGFQAMEWCYPYLSWVFPLWLNLSEKNPHKYCQGYVSMVILHLVKLTMKIKYHSLYASSEPEPQETPHVSAWSLAPLPSSWEQFQASQMIEVRHMERGLAVPVTAAKTNPDGPTPRYLSKHSQNQQICRGDHHWLQMHRQWLLIAECQFGSVSATLHHSSNRHLCRIYKFENGFKEVN